MSMIREQTPELDPTIRRWIAAFNAHDVAALVALYAPDATLFDSGMSAPRQGREEITRWFLWRFRSTPSISYTPSGQKWVDEGNVVVNWVARGNGPRLFGQSWLTRSFRIDGESAFTLHGGLISRQQGTYNHLAVLRQVLPPLRWLPVAVARLIYSMYMRRSGITS